VCVCVYVCVRMPVCACARGVCVCVCVLAPCGVLASQAMSGDERAAPTRMQRWPGEGGAAAICDSQPHINLQPAGAPSGGGWGAMPAALPSRAAADGLARPVGHR
jgi:hypothetical protein